MSKRFITTGALLASVAVLAQLQPPKPGGPVAVTLEWEPVAGASGYKLYYGPESGTYTQAVGIPAGGRFVWHAPNHRHHIVLTATNEAGAESFPSNEVVYDPMPAPGKLRIPVTLVLSIEQ